MAWPSLGRLPHRIAGSDLGMFGLETAVRAVAKCLRALQSVALPHSFCPLLHRRKLLGLRPRPTFLASMISLTRARSLARWLAGWSCCKNKESEGEREGGEEFIHRQA